MADVNKLSQQVIEYAERAAAMSDAAQGKKGIRHRGMGRWLVLPAAGAGLYAMARSKSVARQARGAVKDVKSRASELPDELLGRVRHTSRPSATASSRNGSARRRTTTSARRKSSARAKTSSR